ncbi:phage holin family protein, partial [Zhenhengia yiwuensis]|uniref:phage holin family protein n=1 Tax=Zhenhengia yiwuensis TaxID=2763666 RepID=UPI002A7616AA
MKGFIENIQMMFATVGCFLGWFLGGVDGFMYALVTFVVLDYVTGLMVAILEQRLSSEVGFKGIFKKVIIFILVGAGHMIDYQVIGNGSAIRTAVVFFYIANEGISIIENIQMMFA